MKAKLRWLAVGLVAAGALVGTTGSALAGSPQGHSGDINGCIHAVVDGCGGGGGGSGGGGGGGGGGSW